MHMFFLNDSNVQWDQYTKDRLITKHPDGFYVIKPKDHHGTNAMSCQLCERLYRSKDDVDSNNEFGCCCACALKWAHPRRKQWKTGWRPTKEQINEDLSNRPPLHFKLDLG